jgi:PAP2 superfamily
MPSKSYLMIFFCFFFNGVCIAELARFGQKGLQYHAFGVPCEKLAALPATEAFQGRFNMKNGHKSVGSKHFAFRTVTKKIIQWGLALAVLAFAFVTNAKADDSIAAWNEIAEKAVKTAGHPLPVTSVEFAVVHLAIYDAVESIDHRYEPYRALVPGASGSLSAAAAKAGHDALVGLFPGQSGILDMAYANFLATNNLNPSDPGITVGAQAAAAILALRSNDGRFPANQVPFLGSTAIGQWRPTPSLLPGTPPSLAPGLTPWLASVTPFTMKNNAQFRVDPPPDLASEEWASEYEEVKTVGSLTSTTRTPEQTDIGYFWADSGPLLWQNALRYISRNYLSDIGDSARMYALAEAALADAQIACWESKYFYNSWRPITAIRLGDQDDNPATEVDSEWKPLINTPNFPEYPSGHATISGAVSHALQLFFGTDELNFQITTTNPNAVEKTRSFTRFSQAEDEVVNARVYVGIHYRGTDRVSRTQGLRVANWIFKNYFGPIGDPRFGARH